MNYREREFSGVTWHRCNRVMIENGISHKSVTFSEEQVVETPDGVLTRPLGNIFIAFDEAAANEQFDLVNPSTNEVVGRMTYLDVYAALHSAYLHLASKRDEAPATVDTLGPSPVPVAP